METRSPDSPRVASVPSFRARVHAAALALSFGAVCLLGQVGSSAAAGGASTPPAKQAPSPAAAFALRPGVIVDPERGEAYLMSPQRGIDAVELSSGRLLWSTPRASVPLALGDGRLVAEAEPSEASGVLPIAMLDAGAAGKPLLETTLALPDGVSATIDETPGATFTVDASLQRDALEVAWRFSQRVVRGVAGAEPVPERRVAGAARIDLKTGLAQPMPASEAATEQHSTPLPGALARLVAANGLPGPPQRVGAFFIATGSSGQGRERHATIRRWDAASGDELDEIRLEAGFDPGNPSADGRLLLARKAIGSDASGRQSYLWSIHSLETGDRVAQIRMPTASAPFAIVRSTLLYESRPHGHRSDGRWIDEPLELRAIDLATRAEVWKRPVRDTTYRGARPPGS